MWRVERPAKKAYPVAAFAMRHFVFISEKVIQGRICPLPLT